MADVDSSANTAVGDVVIINVKPDGPYGVVFEADVDGNAAVIKSFERLPNGKFGPLQKHGGLHHGDVLFAINDTYLETLPFAEVMAMVKDRNILKKAFKFMNCKEFYRKRKGGNSNLAGQESKQNFLSLIRRTRLSQDKYNKRFVEYEIGCQLRVPGLRVQKDIVYKWNVWKRYSQLYDLHTKLVPALGWQLEATEFPSGYTFTFNKLSPEFTEMRKDELNAYWQKVLKLDKVTEFTKHHCSPELKAFLEVEETMRNEKLSTPELVGNEEEKQSGGGGGAALGRKSSSRRRSTIGSAQQKGFSFDENSPATTSITAPPSAPPIRRASSLAVTDQPTPSSSSSTSATTVASTSGAVSSSAGKGVAAPAAATVTATATAAPRPATVTTTASPPSSSSVAAKPTTTSSTPAPTGPPPVGALPPKAAGARANLLGSIAALRKD